MQRDLNEQEALIMKEFSVALSSWRKFQPDRLDRFTAKIKPRHFGYMTLASCMGAFFAPSTIAGVFMVFSVFVMMLAIDLTDDVGWKMSKPYHDQYLTRIAMLAEEHQEIRQALYEDNELRRVLVIQNAIKKEWYLRMDAVMDRIDDLVHQKEKFLFNQKHKDDIYQFFSDEKIAQPVDEVMVLGEQESEHETPTRQKEHVWMV